MSNIFGKIARPVLAIALALTVTTTTSGFVTTTVDNLAVDKVAPEVQNSVQADDAIENPSLDVENNVDELVTPDDNKQDAPNPDDYFAPATGGDESVMGAAKIVNADGDATYYATLQAALDVGGTITLLKNVTENVTVTKNTTIDGAGKTYTGMMTLKADTTIKNVNFDGNGYNGYAVETRGAQYVTIKDCTAKNYSYGFVQLASATVLTTVKNVTANNINYGVKVDGSNAVVLENVDITAGVAAVLNSNYGEKTITIKDSKLNILGTWTRNNTIKTNYVFEGANTIDQFIIDAAIDNFELAADATLTAPNEITVNSRVSYGNVVYKNGMYFVKITPKGQVAYRADVTDKDDREGIAILLKDVLATESLVVKVYHDNTLMFTCTRRDIDDEGNVMFPVINTNTTANIVLWGRESGSWENEILVKPTSNNIPNKIEVWADGVLTNAYTHSTGTVLGDQIEKYLALDCVEKIVDVAEINGVGYATLAEAIAAAQANDTIKFLADVNENVTIDQAITIDGADFKYTGTITTTGDIALTVQNVNFVKGYIDANTSALGRNLTVKDCTFDGVDKSIDYAIIVRHGDAVVIENSSATNYSYGMLYVPQHVGSITVKDVIVKNALAAFNISYSGDALFEKVAFENVSYGIHFQIWSDGSRTYTVKNSDLSGATNPFWFWDKSNNTEKVTVVFEGNNIVPNFQPIAHTTSGVLKLAAGATLTAPEGLTISTDEGYGVKYENGKYASVRVAAKIGDIYYETFAEALAAAQAGNTITLLADITSNDIIVIDKAITLDGNGYKLTSTADRAINVSGANGVTIRNLTIQCSGERAINIIKNATNVTIDNVIATAANYTVNVASSAANAVVAINDSNLTGLNVVNVAAAGAQVTVTGGTLTCNDQNDAENYAALSLNKDAVNGTITATGVTFEIKGNSDLASNGAEGGTITVDGSADGVSVDVAYIAYGDYYYGYTSLAAAIEAAKAGETVALLRDVTLSDILVINKAITLDGNGHKLTSTAGRAINVATEGQVTIKNLTIDAKGERAINVITKPATLTIENVTATAANYTVNVASSAGAAKVTINKSTLNGLCTVNVAAAGAEVTIDNSTINCNDNNTTAGESYAALCLNKEAVGGSIIATNTTVNVTAGSDSEKCRNGAENGTVTLNGSTEGVTVTVAVITYPGSDYYYGFTSLADAIEFAQAGYTITLIRDVTAKDIIVIDKAITLNGNGKTLTSTAARAINIETEGKVVISNLTINAGERAVNIINKAATVELNNVTATANNNAVMIATSAGAVKLTVNDSTLTGLAVVNVSGAGAEVEINNTKITNVDASTAEQYGAITVWNSAAGAKVVVSGGNISVADDSHKAIIFAAGATVTGVDDVKYIVAMIGDAGFFTLADAIEFAKAGDTITLLAPVVVEKGETLTLDKNVTITYTSNVVGEDMITVRGTLNVEAGKITYINTDKTGNNVTVSTISAEPGSVVNVTGGIIENKTVYSTGSYAYAIDMLTNGSLGDVTVTISGGKVYSDYMAIRQFNNGTACKNSLTVTGGEIYGAKRAIQIHINNDAAYLAISGGKIEAGEGGYALCLFPETATHIAVIGGEFIGTVYSGTNGIISGGIYSEELYAGYLKEGFVLSENANGTYGVKEGIKGSGTEADPYEIGSVEDLIMFRDSVNAGETKYSAPGVYVVLTADIDLAGINWVGIGSITAEHGFMGNFDGNGYKIKNLTITNPDLDSDGYAYAGLFGLTEGTDVDNQNYIKNLIIENVTINTTGHIVAAAIAYPYYTTVDNIKVCGNIAINGGDYTAGVLAYTRRCVNARNLTVEGTVGSYITGKQTVGGVISDIQMNGGLTANYSNFSVKRVTITGTKQVGGISGIISGQTVTNCKVDDVALICEDDRVGAVSGSMGTTSTIVNADVKRVYINDEDAMNIIGGTYNDGAPIQAKVGNTYYASFTAALEAAKTGDTITLLNNVTLTDKDVVVTSSGVKAMLNISGKSITLDLNGKTIYLENNSAEMIYAGIFVDKDAALTIKDSDEYGKGGIRAEKVKELANGKQDIGYMILNYSTTTGAKNLVIEGGNFYANNLEDSIVYSQGNETTVIKGGTFVLDAIGTRANGHPWIFNAKGQNTQHILVEGGSFNADVLHQYWIFEVEALYSKALKYNAETGMYTVVDAVAYVTERHWSGNWYTQNIGYATLEEAIAACQGVQSKIYYSKEYLSEPEMVVLLKNIELNKTVTIENGQSVIINLMGLKVAGTFSGTGNQEMFLVKGNLTVKNGHIEMKATVNQGWGAMATIFDVTAGGVLNMDNINAKVSGTDMNFIVHLNNWGEVTLNVTNSTLNATYCAVRVFNSGYDMNNVTIKNSTLTGKTRAFWVHNYIGDLDSSKHSDDAIRNRLNFDIFNNGNTFEITDEATEYPIRYGFNDETTVFYTAEGQRVVNTLEDFQNAINNGESNIILGGDIDLSNGLVFP